MRIANVPEPGPRRLRGKVLKKHQKKRNAKRKLEKKNRRSN